MYQGGSKYISLIVSVFFLISIYKILSFNYLTITQINFTVNMSYSIDIKNAGAYQFIEVTVSEPLHVELTVKIASEAMELARKNNINNSIWDLRKAELQDTFMQTHIFVEGLAALGVKVSDKVAIVYKDSAARYEHANNVAFNRGFINFKYFNDFESAKTWLDSKNDVN